MKNILIWLLLSVLLVQESRASCAEWKQLESDCGSYCLKVLRPVLDHTRALQSQVNDFQHQTETVTKVEDPKKLIHEKIDILATRIEQKLEDLHKLIDIVLLKQTESNTRQNGDYLGKFQNIERQLEKIDALESRLDQRLANQSKLTEATLHSQNSDFLSKFQKNLKSLLQDNLEIMEKKWDQRLETLLQKSSDSLKIQFDSLAKIENIKGLQDIFETLQGKLNTQFENMKIQSKSMKLSINELCKLNKTKKVVVRKPFKEIESKYYYFEDHQKLSWFDAALKCLEYGGHLASIQNDDEFFELPDILEKENNYNSEMESYWIDINDLETEGRFLSATTGQRPGYLNWHKGEPNNLESVEHCVELRYLHDIYRMNDANCDAEHYFICESENVYKQKKKLNRG